MPNLQPCCKAMPTSTVKPAPEKKKLNAQVPVLPQGVDDAGGEEDPVYSRKDQHALLW